MGGFMYKRKGFTLIELLVVIAIIALLMAILMPALARVKKQAKAVACTALLRQWGVMWSMYCDDNDGYFPISEITDAGGTLGWRRGTWVVALRPQYRTRAGILTCPMAVKRHPNGNAWGGPLNTYVMGEGGLYNWQEEASYGANCWIYKPMPGQTAIQNRPTEWNWKHKDVAGANFIPVFADTMWRGGGPYEKGTGGDPPQFDGQWIDYNREMMHFCINRHQGNINMLFMDWSVRKVGLKELWKLKWHREFNTNDYWTKASSVQPGDWPVWMRNFKDY